MFFLDQLMKTKHLRVFQGTYLKYREQIIYLFFGGLTFFVNFFVFTVLDHLMIDKTLTANVIAWIAGVMFAFYTNRRWVFVNKEQKNLMYQFISFSAGRLFTLVLEEVVLFIGCDVLQLWTIGIKLMAQIVVIILNYVISKVIVFNNRKEIYK